MGNGFMHLITDSMLLWGALLLPALGAVICLVFPRPALVRRIIVGVSIAQTGLALLTARRVLIEGALIAGHEWLRVDAFSAFHLLVLALVYLASSIFAATYFRHTHGAHRFRPRIARRFGFLWLGALAAMSLLLISNNLGMMWVGMESTTLLTAFLISLYTDKLSLEAMWKYLIICSVGIAFAFMGTLLAAASVRHMPQLAGGSMSWTSLMNPTTVIDPTLMIIAFVFIMVGFGVKAGLAPVHSWLPDAHSQAPAPVSAMFSGFMLNAALYCIMRYAPLVERTLHHNFASILLLGFGALSMLVSAAFIVFQTDAKRLLAYHSVEHLGIIALGYGLGPIGVFAALFHTLNHSLCKTLAFCGVGRLGQYYGTHDMHAIRGALRVDRLWGLALLGSMLALIGVAPFAIFMSEYQIVRAAIAEHAWVMLAVFALGGSIIFVSALRHVMDMVYGEPSIDTPARAAITMHDGIGAVAMVGGTLGLLVILGLWLPGPLLALMQQAVRVVSG